MNTDRRTLLSEIHHRVKNNLALISALIQLELDSSKDVQTKDLLKGLQARLNAIVIPHEILYQESNLSEIDFSKNIVKLTEKIANYYNFEIQFNYNLNPVLLNINQAIPCSLIICEVFKLLCNINYKNSKVSPVVEVGLFSKKKWVNLIISFKHIPDINSQANSENSLELINTLKHQLSPSNYTELNNSYFELIFKQEDFKGPYNSL